MKIHSGTFEKAHSKKIAIVASRFNEYITKSLVEGAHDALLRHGAKDDNISLFWVPGAFEIPVVAKAQAMSKKYDAIICLGAVIKGETPHFDYISSMVASGIARLSYDYTLPVIFGVLTTNTFDEALQRAGCKMGNKGAEAAVSALEMISILS